MAAQRSFQTLLQLDVSWNEKNFVEVQINSAKHTSTCENATVLHE
jgi:hypothetical protein